MKSDEIGVRRVWSQLGAFEKVRSVPGIYITGFAVMFIGAIRARDLTFFVGLAFVVFETLFLLWRTRLRIAFLDREEYEEVLRYRSAKDSSAEEDTEP